jgi:4a-hydroxytetrahydrobiopterin dehydratase
MDKLAHFNVTEQGLTAEFQFSDFSEAWGFMSKVALCAERLQHHPEWSNSYNVVRINLITYEAGTTITHKDYELALQIEKLCTVNN